MPSQPFGANSMKLLLQGHPDLQKLFTEVNKQFQCTIVSGSRTIAEEKEMVTKGLSKTMNSMHLVQSDGYCHALDVAPDPVNYERKLYNLDEILFAGYVLAVAYKMKQDGLIEHDIRYGGDWNSNGEVSDESFQDLDHFEII